MFLELEQVTKVFGKGFFSSDPPTIAVNNVSVEIDDSEPKILTVAGESGSGKTTLSRLMLGSISPTKGKVLYKGKPLHKLSRREKLSFKQGVQPIFQDPFASYNPFYKIDHVLHAPIKNFSLAKRGEDARAMVESALMEVGLRPEEILGRHPHQLSGGQRQRIMVARALLMKPGLILADEPVSMVDASLRATILESISELRKNLGISVVYITHDLTTAYQISDTLMVMYSGFVMEYGNVEKVIHNAQHPYTQLLLESIPQPDPTHIWEPISKNEKRDYGLDRSSSLIEVEPDHWVRTAGDSDGSS